jgi:dolichyl-phosphate beta-glucosyltransferase
VSDLRTNPFLSIIIPAYNEEKRLPPTLVKIADFLRHQPYDAEVLVVENGSADNTSQVVEKFIGEQARPEDRFVMRLLHSPKGKGNAVKHGVDAARGDYLLITDSDLSVPIEETPRFLPPILELSRKGIAIASREVAGAVRYNEPSYRHLMGRVFNWLVRRIAVPGIHDTQCGFKCFGREAAQLVFPLQRIDGWGFDVELLFIAQRHDLPIIEVPISWYYREDSRVRPVLDTLTMVGELMKIRRNGREGIYDHTPPPLADKATVS